MALRSPVMLPASPFAEPPSMAALAPRGAGFSPSLQPSTSAAPMFLSAAAAAAAAACSPTPMAMSPRCMRGGFSSPPLPVGSVCAPPAAQPGWISADVRQSGCMAGSASGPALTVPPARGSSLIVAPRAAEASPTAQRFGGARSGGKALPLFASCGPALVSLNTDVAASPPRQPVPSQVRGCCFGATSPRRLGAHARTRASI
eukprot:CAMPEP_0176271312 /NCGR_PEP_ID=MMETSP0121_2-20121125/45139_1 /TAXON_ID=160619 /ORGANISM="Kryptoperidinium foliaceum, Strain CCMP 1326" /LENGTH=201 /DNA_ID=CAMNT_0017611461 /DNA_START=113 /DNA_END=718 /DNA_ORIENTATION=+